VPRPCSRGQPDEVGAAVPSLLGRDAVLLHEVLSAVGKGREHRHAEPLDEALRVALVPRRRQHHRRLALGRELVDLARRSDRVEQEEAVAVVDRVGRNHLVPRLARLPLRVRCLEPHRRKALLARESPPIPAQAGSAKTGLSRRRSRVRVPSLPSHSRDCGSLAGLGAGARWSHDRLESLETGGRPQGFRVVVHLERRR
jgi:hypothetical protein